MSNLQIYYHYKLYANIIGGVSWYNELKFPGMFAQ